MCMRVHMLLYPSAPLFWTCKGSSHLQHWSKAILKVIYKKNFLLPRAAFLLKASLLHSPWDSQEWHSFPVHKGKVTFPNADGNPVTMWTGWWEELGSRSPSPFPTSTPNPRVQVRTLPAAIVPVTILCSKNQDFFKPRSSPWAVHSTAYQATGPADNQALHSPCAFSL